MFGELKGKRLLVLGGRILADYICAFAKENGIILLTTGKNPHMLFDEYYYVDPTDSQGMKQLIQDKKVDGVYLGSEEEWIRQATLYLAELDMPCYCTRTQWDMLMNKRQFKELCIKFDLPVVQSYKYTPANPCEIEFPVITKPADGCGSDGVTICNSMETLKMGYQIAIDNSPTGEALVEKVVNNSGMDVFFWIENGKVEFCGLGDEYPIQLAPGAGSIAGARIMPSIYTDEFRSFFEEKIKNLFHYVGLTQGLIWIEVFHDGKDYYFNEAGYRCNGSKTIISIDYLYQINSVGADIYFALTGNGKTHGFSPLILKDHTIRKKKVCEFWITVSAGIVGAITGIETVKNHPNVLAVIERYEVGKTVPHTNAFDQNFCVVHFAYDNAKELKTVIDFIQKTVCVNNVAGEDMIIHKDTAFIEKLLADNRDYEG